MNKKRLGYVLVGILILFSLYSCDFSKNFLSPANEQKLTGISQWANKQNADIFLNDVYGSLKILYNSPESLDNYTDFNDAGYYYPSWKWKQGITNPDAVYGGNIFFGGAVGVRSIINWHSIYTKIRKANTFITQVKKHSKNFPEKWMHKRIDEAKFLRAFWYSRLWQTTGGIPIITKPLNINTMDSSQIYHKRATFKKTYNFIVSQLTSIINDGYLAVKYSQGDSNAGRATIGAALMLKGWVQLYAASPAFNAATPAVGSNPNECCGFGNYKKSRWANAAATFKKFINKYGNGHPYSLFPDDKTFWYPSNEYNSGVVWDRQIVANTSQASTYSQYGGPVYIHGIYFTWGNYDPTQELVNQYYMANGKPIGAPNSGYDPQHPYKNRGQRFYDWIVYNGAYYNMKWMSKPDTIYTWINKVHPSDNEIDFGKGDVGNTGYYSKKKLNPNVKPGGSSGANWVYFRYAEVLLGYAEAENEAVGPTPSVYNAVDKIRARAGLPSLETVYGGQTLSQKEMRKEIHQERNVEFSYEDKRYWDIIRWGLADKVMNEDHHGMKITNTHPSDNSGKWVHEVIPLHHPNTFHQYMYLSPVPQPVLDRNPKIIQNPGY